MRRRAFTLLEVMVAVGILAFALISISEIVGGALRSQALSRDLQVATLLARGKLSELTEKYERVGFKLGGDEEDGSFDEEGQPRFKWKSKVIEPSSTLDARSLATTLMGGGSVQDLFAPKADADGRAVVNPTAVAMAAAVEQQVAVFAESIKKGVRELRLTVSWKGGARDESFTVTTHLVVLQPGGGT
jgi:general secretion pathway protein I